MATDFSLPVFSITDIVISGTSYKLPVFQTGKTVKVKLAASPFTEYTGVEDGTTGIYKFTGVGDGKYHKLVDGVQSGTFGVTDGRYIADDSLPYAKLAGGNYFTGNQSIDGNLVVNALLTIGGAAGFADSIEATDYIKSLAYMIAPELFVDAAGTPFTTNTPTYNSSLVWKGWVESRLASIVLTPFQESINKRRVIVGGSIEANKVYTLLKDASNSFASPSATNMCWVEIVGAGAASAYLTMPGNTLRDYVHWIAPGQHIKVIMADGFSNSKYCTFQNMTLFFGANDYSVDREYANMTFINCDIYAYKNTTFNNCRLIRCRIIHASTYQAKLKGNTICELTGFNNDYDKSLLSAGYEPSGGYLIYGEAMPTDPSSIIIDPD